MQKRFFYQYNEFVSELFFNLCSNKLIKIGGINTKSWELIICIVF